MICIFIKKMREKFTSAEVAVENMDIESMKNGRVNDIPRSASFMSLFLLFYYVIK